MAQSAIARMVHVTDQVLAETPVSEMSMLICTGCGTKVDATKSLCFGCPRSKEFPNACHVLMPAASVVLDAPETKLLNPFMRFRTRLFPYRVARCLGLSDDDWASIVDGLDEGLRRVEPAPGGFKRTPLEYYEDLGVWAKNESGQVGQSHKARHLANIMLYLQVLLRARVPVAENLQAKPLAVASCGNAALAAATLAAAASWPILVFIPDDAEPAVVERLRELNATIQVCPKADNSALGGDATVHHFRQAVENGAIPFSVQASDNALAAEGGSTLIWEALEQLQERGAGELGSVVVHVGGGALASGTFTGLELAQEQGLIDQIPDFHTVQLDGCSPLAKCYNRLLDTLPATPVGSRRAKAEVQKAISAAASCERDFMQVWPDPQGAAHGILDDETYDWQKVCEGMLRTGGVAHTIPDARIMEAWTSARAASAVDMCHTGAAGYAGVLHMRSLPEAAPREPTLVIFSGKQR
jgi:threonine synthase